MADSRIKSASEILSAFFDRDLVRRGEYYALFDRSWKSIAGGRLAPHSKPIDIKHGVLIVETEHQGWMQLLQLQQDRMLGEIQRRFPDLGVRSIAFRLGNAEGLGGISRGRDAAADASRSEVPLAATAEAPREDKRLFQPKAPGGAGRNEVSQAQPKDRSTVPPETPSKTSPSSVLPGELRDIFEKIRKNIRR